VTNFKIGDRIFGQSDLLGRGSLAGGLQQYSVLEAGVSAHIPDSITFEEAATVPVNAIASFVGIFHKTGLDIGFPEIKAKGLESQKIVIVGGGSSTGKFAIEFAKLAGFGEIVTVAGLSNEKVLRELGATHVVDRHAPDAGAQVREIVGDDLVYALDSSSRGDSQSFVVSLLSNTKRGEYASLLPGQATQDVAETKKAGFERKGVLGLTHKLRDIAVPFWEHLPGWLVDGTVQAQPYAIIDGLDAEKVNALLDAYRDGKPTTRTLIRPSKL
jgi:NADPH2:quinone reductase